MNDSSPQQTSVPKSKKYFLSKKWWIMGAVVILLLGGAVGSWLLIATQKSSQSQDKESLNAKQAAETNVASVDADKLANNGNTEGAKAAYDVAVAKTTDLYQKSVLLINKAVVSLNEGKIDEALLIALESETLNQNDNVAQFIAGIYETKGDTTKAIEYYKKAIALIDKKSPMDISDIKYFQSKVDELSGVKN